MPAPVLLPTRSNSGFPTYKHISGITLPAEKPGFATETIYLFSAEEKASDYGENGEHSDSFLSWTSVLHEEKIRAIKVPGNHHSMVTKHVSETGSLLTEAISHATKQRSDPPEMHYHPEVTIQTGKRNKAPIFCIPGAGGNAVGFNEFAAALDDDWSLRALQPRGLDGELVPHVTVEAAASAYLRAINATQPDGPIHLIGHSFGGWVAFEIALQMRSIDRIVSSLTLVDTNIPTKRDVAGDQYSASQVVQELIQVLELKVEGSLGINLTMLESLDGAGRLELLHKRMVRMGLMSQHSRPKVLRGLIRAFGAALRTEYQPEKSYPDPVRLVLVPDKRLDSEANRCQHEEALMGWKRWAPQVISWAGPGNHMTILNQPHVQILADWWRNAL